MGIASNTNLFHGSISMVRNLSKKQRQRESHERIIAARRKPISSFHSAGDFRAWQAELHIRDHLT
jgi:hypothetical protein